MTTSIYYHAATADMGDTPEQGANNFRSWAYAEIKAAYPDAEIEVIDECGSSRVYAYALDGDMEFEDEDAEESILLFLCELWDRCPWSGEFFE